VEHAIGVAASEGVFRFTLDPEALPDYPTAQLMAFGNPLLDRIFEHAQSLGQVAQVYLTGFNLSPHDLPSTVRRSLQVPSGIEVRSAAPRAYHFAAALFWFQATFISDEKVQGIFSVGIDRYYGRLTRTLAETLRSATLSDTRSYPYPDVPGLPLKRAYQLAREEATHAITVTAHSHLAELQQYLQRETQRLTGYFTDLRSELADRQARAVARGEDTTQFDSQRQALDREEQTQLADLRHKLALHVQIRLLNVLRVIQPKLRLRVQLVPAQGIGGEIEVVFDPALQKVEATVCPDCARPTLALALRRSGQVVCPACAARPHGLQKAKSS
ncbi:MAG TPA: hypothetical protein VFF59_05225, partial [Anaerolineae bacterium]|nr:hypothetical protein [Anaerolineae bacterium]